MMRLYCLRELSDRVFDCGLGRTNCYDAKIFPVRAGHHRARRQSPMPTQRGLWGLSLGAVSLDKTGGGLCQFISLWSFLPRQFSK
jgi:hypothetical protein